MPDLIVQQVMREVHPLHASDPIGYAARRVVEAGLPAIPVIDERGDYCGLFGEREFLTALFPAYVGTLMSARMVRRSLDDAIDRRVSCQEQEIRNYLTTDPILFEDDFSDTQLAETFLHHRVLVIPIATEGRVHAVVTRNDFFRALQSRISELVEDFGD